MRKFIISEEEKRRILNLHEGFKKGLLKEQYTKVEGPFKDVAAANTGDLYIMKVEKTMCVRDSENYFQLTGTTCPEGYKVHPSGKFYVQHHSGMTDGKIKMFPEGSNHYVNATNNGQGYNTAEEVKKAVSLLLNPKGNTGRQVQKGTDDDGTKYKQVTKYNQQGDVQKNKLKMTTATGDKSVEKSKSGL